MESALASIILFTVGLFAFMTITHTQLSTQDAVWMADQARQERIIERGQTALAAVSSTTQSNGSFVQVTIRNTGTVKLSDFERWDVIVQYYTAPGNYRVAWLPYTPSATPEDMRWTVVGIYHNAAGGQAEVFEPGILNPGEEIVLRARVLPPVGPHTVNRITVTVPNGATVSTAFTRNN